MLPVADLTLAGTTSAGKSTLANAIAGRWLLAFTVQETTRGTIDIVLDGKASREDEAAYPHEPLIGHESGAHSRRVTRLGRGFVARTAVRGFRFAEKRAIVLRDTPGILTASDGARLAALEAAAAASKVVAVLLSAEDTNVAKKRSLASTVLRGAEVGNARVVWVLSRTDAFQRDRDPLRALARYRVEMARLIYEAGGSVDQDGRLLLSLAPRPAFLAAMLSTRTGPRHQYASELWRWMRDDLAVFGLLHRFEGKHPAAWSRHRQLLALRSLWKASGAAQFDDTIATLLSNRTSRSRP